MYIRRICTIIHGLLGFGARTGMCRAGLTTVVCACVHRTHTHTRAQTHTELFSCNCSSAKTQRNMLI